MANEGWLLLGLGAAALWMFGRGEESSLVDTASTASGMGAAPRQPVALPAGLKIPGTNVPAAASTDEDIGVYPGPVQRGALDFAIPVGPVAVGTSDNSPVKKAFQETQPQTIVHNYWEQPEQIAQTNAMPMVAIRDTIGGGLETTTNIATLDSKEKFRAVNVDTGFTFHTSPGVLEEYVQGFTGTPPVEEGPVWEAPEWATFAEPVTGASSEAFWSGYGEG
jgi:hypothetical protein